MCDIMCGSFLFCMCAWCRPWCFVLVWVLFIFFFQSRLQKVAHPFTGATTPLFEVFTLFRINLGNHKSVVVALGSGFPRRGRRLPSATFCPCPWSTTGWFSSPRRFAHRWSAGPSTPPGPALLLLPRQLFRLSRRLRMVRESGREREREHAVCRSTRVRLANFLCHPPRCRKLQFV